MPTHKRLAFVTYNMNSHRKNVKLAEKGSTMLSLRMELIEISFAVAGNKKQLLIVVIILQLKFTVGFVKVIIGWCCQRDIFYLYVCVSSNHQPWNWYIFFFYLFHAILFESFFSSASIDCCEFVSLQTSLIRLTVHFFSGSKHLRFFALSSYTSTFFFL